MRTPITLRQVKPYLSPHLVKRYEAEQVEIRAVYSLLCAEPACRHDTQRRNRQRCGSMPYLQQESMHEISDGTT